MGRGTYSAGECSRTPSMTQVRYNPAITEVRRDTVDGLYRRVSCSHRTYNSTSCRSAARRVKILESAPAEEDPQVGIGVQRLTLEPGQVRGDGHRQPRIGG